MKQKLMTITEYCKYKDLSRTAFYGHKRRGVFKGCFVKKPGYSKDFVDVSKADAALSKYVSWNAGAAATKKKFKPRTKPNTPSGLTDEHAREWGFAVPEPETPEPELIPLTLATFFLSEFLADEWGFEIVADPEGYDPEDLQTWADEGLDVIFSILCDIAAGTAENPGKSALTAVLLTLATVKPGEIQWTDEPTGLERAIQAELKKGKKP